VPGICQDMADITARAVLGREGGGVPGGEVRVINSHDIRSWSTMNHFFDDEARQRQRSASSSTEREIRERGEGGEAGGGRGKPESSICIGAQCGWDILWSFPSMMSHDHEIRKISPRELVGMFVNRFVESGHDGFILSILPKK
jgi:hypothetical protein